MGRHTVFKYWESALPGPLCELIIAEAAGYDRSRAHLHPVEGDDYVDETIRKTELLFWDESHWTSGLTMHFAQLANREIWNYHLCVTQGVQYGHYSDGGTYDWHKDEFDQPFADEAPEKWRGLSRKLSVVIILSDPLAYQGGDLCFKDTYGNQVQDADLSRAIRQRGSVIVFPAYILHTVTPVTRGERSSLVSWVLGNPFS